MERKTLIKICKNRVFLTPEMSFSLSQTSLVGTHLSFRTFDDIYFEIEVLAYDDKSNKINAEIVDYQPKNTSSFKEQTPPGQVSFIHFEPLKWQHIERHLSSYTKSVLLRERIVFDDIRPSAGDSSKNPFSRTLKSNEGSGSALSGVTQIYTEPKQQESLIERITEDAKIYFEEAEFNLGFVSFSYKSKKLNETYGLKIENHFLKTEFNAIKSYFQKVFGGRKQFSIKIIFTLTDRVVTGIMTTSSEIESINEDILESIKRERVARLITKPLRNSVEKSLFTSEDIFDNFGDNQMEGNVFRQSEEDILSLLIKTPNIRNAKHLQFLSGSKHSIKQKLRFTLNPLFGFVFFIEGETKNHFCWELLNSHATYLWSFDKIESDTKAQWRRVEQIINNIRDIGRNAYKMSFKNNKSDGDLSFCAIEHCDINASFKDGFIEWQHRLEERLV